MTFRLRQDHSQVSLSAVEGPAATWVRLLGSTESLASAVEFLSRGRYRCRPLSAETPRVIVTEPSDAETLGELRQRYPDAALVVWDRRAAAKRAHIAQALEAGVDSYLCSGEVQSLVAELDALLAPSVSVVPDFGRGWAQASIEITAAASHGQGHDKTIGSAVPTDNALTMGERSRSKS